MTIALRQDYVEVNIQDAKKQRTLLPIAATRNHIQIVRLLLADSRTDVKIPDVYGQTPLNGAIQARQARLPVAALNNRIIPSCCDTSGCTILHLPQKPASLVFPAAC
ncbi:hypothetical protein Asppvi_005482 [Aspergillus pseudoviridinutans]|uniref:Ankyrin repeat-containing domain protein n=1 Tax=Aspergillus pseudoviridinutans TaxID=1517512 RepID=A0A9P3B8C5_9EURO|nr:uncharacterized protein Asppvi_005482 [Aspergillus pseudoviridinutans]GIJ86592.1 hypothetical protein Asppvi_005482 [Aspergillus pseudoviridinutans]